MNIKEVAEAISELNYQYYDSSKEFQNYCPFECVCTGYQILVKFFGICIWDDDNNDMEWDETGNKYKLSIKQHLAYKANDLIKTGIFKLKPKA